jgi:hypothetical protein
MIRIFILTSVMALGLVAISGADEGKKESNKEKPKTAVVPFELLKSGHMAVNVKVNGKGPFKLIFDTGAPITLVNNKLAKEAKLLDGQEKPLFSLFGTMGEARIKELQIGEAKATDTSAVVMDHPTVEALAQGLKTPIYGLVGFPFFAQFRMTLDYKAKTMTLTPNGYKVKGNMLQDMTEAILSGAKPRNLAPSAQWGVVCTKEQGDEDDGVDIKGVVPSSAADKAGLKRGDRLLTLDGRWTDSMTDLYEAAGHVKAGRTVKVKVKRGD